MRNLFQVAGAIELSDPANTAQLLAHLQNSVSKLFKHCLSFKF